MPHDLTFFEHIWMSHSVLCLTLTPTPFGSYQGPPPFTDEKPEASKSSLITRGHRADECRCDGRLFSGRQQSSWAAATKRHKLRGSDNRNLFSPVLEAGSSKPRCGQARAPSETCHAESLPVSWSCWCLPTILGDPRLLDTCL